MMKKFMKALERYYNEYLLGYSQDANWAYYDMDMQMTKDRVERILQSNHIEKNDLEFLKSVIPEIENGRIRADLEEQLDILSTL